MKTTESKNGTLATVALLTKNAEEYMEELLDSLNNQETDFDYEILVIDSGSKDATQAISKKKGAKLHIIDPKTFNHGDTRNLAIRTAKGKYIAFLTQDALPAEKNWLSEMIAPFLKDEKVAGVFGKHFPRPDCNPLVARDIDDHFENLYHNKETENKLSDNSKELSDDEWNRLRFFSNVNSCINRDIWNKIPFPRANYCEDQLWAEAVIKAGYKTVYSPTAAVYHSHSFPFVEAFRRYYDEYLGLWDAFRIAPGKSLVRGVLRGVKFSLKDIKYVSKAKNLKVGGKVYYTFYAPIFNTARQIAAHLAYRNRLKQDRWNKNISRDKHIKES